MVEQKGKCKKLKTLASKIIENIKHSPIPSWINIKPHTKTLSSLVSIIDGLYTIFNKKLKDMVEDKKKSQEKKKTSELGLDIR